MAGSGVVSILFTDLVDSTAYEEQLGSSEWDRLRAVHFASLRSAAAEHEGREVKSAGDGVMMVFDSVVNSLDCAVKMQQLVDRDNRRLDDAVFGMRAGLSAGEVTASDGDYYGLPVNEASRLCASAVGGEIVVSDVVRQLSRGRTPHTFTDRGELQLKGLSEPVRAWVVAWSPLNQASPMPARLRRGGDATAFVGREVQLDGLRSALKATAAGEFRVVMVAGEPGIGKTRLAGEVAQEAHDAGATVLFGRCEEGLAAPFMPFVDALRSYVTTAAQDAIESIFERSGAELARIVPEISAISSADPSRADASSADAETERYRLFEAFVELLATFSQRAPVVLVLDDLHWSDGASLLLLVHLAGSGRLGRVLIVGTYRETDLARTHPLSGVLGDLRRHRSVERMVLHGLDRDDVSDMIDGIASSVADEVRDLAGAIREETSGNPFFVEEVLRHLVESGGVHERDGMLRLGARTQDLGIPEGVRDVIGRRLSRLPDAANDVLAIGSVVGREFDLATVETVGRATGDDLVELLDAAVRARLISEVPGAFGLYAFNHALVRQVLYDELSAVRRARLHWQIGEVLASRGGDRLDEVAHHAIEGALAGDPGRAVDLALRAGEQARSMLALESALVWFERARTTLDQAEVEDPEGHRRFAALLGSARIYGAWLRGNLAWRLTREAVHIAMAAGDMRRVSDALFVHGALLRSEPDAELVALIEAALETLGDEWTAERVSTEGLLLLHQASWYGRHVSFDRALALLEIARRRNDPVVHERLLYLNSFMRRGSYLESDVLSFFDEGNALVGADIDADVSPGFRLLFLGIARLVLGDRDGFDEIGAELVSIFDRSAGTVAITPGFSNLASTLDGRWADARASAATWIARVGAGNYAPAAFIAIAQRAVSILEEYGGSRLIEGIQQLEGEVRRTWRPTLVACLWEEGRHDEALVELQVIVSAGGVASLEQGISQPFWMRWMTEAVVRLEHHALAQDLYDVLLPYSGLLLVSFFGVSIDGAADRCLAQLSALLGRSDEAARRFEAALLFEQRLRGRPQAARTTYWYARFLMAQGDPDGAEMQALAESEARALGMRLLERQAQQLLQEFA